MVTMLRRLLPLLLRLLAGSCLCVCGTPVHLSDLAPMQDSVGGSAGGWKNSRTVRSTHQDVKSPPSDREYITGLVLNVDAGGGGAGGGGAGPNGRPEGMVTQTGNGDSLDGRSGLSQADDGETWSQVKKDGSSSDTGGADPEEDVSHSTGGREQQVDHMSSSAPSEPDLGEGASDGGGLLEETGPASVTEGPNPSTWIQRLTPDSAPGSTPPTLWGRDGAPTSSLPEPLLPEMGPNMMPREDGPESLWTEAARPSGVDTVVPLSQDEATEGTMSSEALPLIFEPFEDATPEGASSSSSSSSSAAAAAAAAAAASPEPGSSQSPAAMATGGMPPSEVDLEPLATVETDGEGPSHAPPPLLMPDWMSPWQTSGTELREAVGSSGPSVSQRRDGVAVRTPNLEEHLPTARPSLLSSLQHAMTTVAMAAHRPVHKSRSGLEEMEESEEEEDEEDEENSEESVEDGSEEELTDTPKIFATQPPYSLIPPPPVWVQRNQGLMRSWVELIREKAGYVSGMLAPVGIGITGALLIVGALYSIRMIHRKRRNSFKHQRRKVRQPEQPREPSTSGQDQAMLLADSSEDEF